jgi:hypothetical protein
MASVMIGYDLNKPHQDYKDLIDAIKECSSNWWHCLDSTWIIKTEMSPKLIRDRLAQHIDSNDELLVATLTGEAAWKGFDDACSKWLTNNL